MVAGREPCVNIQKLDDAAITDTLLLADVVKMKRARGQLPTSKTDFWIETDPFNSGTYGMVHRCYIQKNGEYLLCIGKTPRPGMSLDTEKTVLAILSNNKYCHIPAYAFLDDDWLMMEEVVLLPEDHKLLRSGRLLGQKLQESIQQLHALGVAHNDLDHDLNIGFINGELEYIDFGRARLKRDADFDVACRRDDENIKRIIQNYA